MGGTKNPAKQRAIKIVKEETAKTIKAEYGGDRAAFLADAGSNRLGPGSKYGRRIITRARKDPLFVKGFKAYHKLGKNSGNAKLTAKMDAKLNGSWWNAVLSEGRSGGEKVKANSSTTIAVGEVRADNRINLSSGKAKLAAQQGKGVYAVFDDPEAGIEALEAVRDVSMGRRADSIPNVFRSFEDGVVEEIATETVLYRLGLLADKTGETVGAILGGLEIDDLVEMEVSAIFETVEEELEAAAGDDHEVFLRAESLVVIKTDYDDIVKALETGIAAAIACKSDAGNGPYAIVMGIKAVMEKQNCVGGGTVQQGRKPGDYKQKWYTAQGIYVIDAFGPQGWVFDLDSLANGADSKDASGLHQKVSIPGTDNYLRILNNKNVLCEDGLPIVDVGMIDNKGKTCTRKLHQILQLNLASWGLGMRHNTEYQRFLRGRTRGASSAEQAFPYSGEDYDKYLRRLEAKGWTQVEFARWCDVDHCVGRSEPWMHNTLFTRVCSHRWNQCMAAVRYKAEDWCFGFGSKVYASGSD